LFLGEKPSSIVDGAIRTSRGWAIAHHFYPRITNSYVSLRKNDDEDINRVAGRFGTGINPRKSPAWDWDKSPEIPSLSNGVNAASPPLVVVGGIAYSKRGAFLGS
jgi:hypothetical protein